MAFPSVFYPQNVTLYFYRFFSGKIRLSFILAKKICITMSVLWKLWIFFLFFCEIQGK